jgi:hypothetical protein
VAKWRPTRAQFFALGLPAESCTAPARALANVFAADNVFELAGHGFSDGDLVRFTATGDTPLAPAALPAPLSGAVLYEAVVLGGDLFQVRPQGGGAVINITDAGAGVISTIADNMAKLDLILELVARWVDDHAIPYRPPDETQQGWPPESFVRAGCKIAALDFATNVRAASPTYSIDEVRKEAEAMQAWLNKLREGKPLAVPPVDATPAVPEMGPRVFSRRPPRGFRRDSV